MSTLRRGPTELFPSEGMLLLWGSPKQSNLPGKLDVVGDLDAKVRRKRFEAAQVPTKLHQPVDFHSEVTGEFRSTSENRTSEQLPSGASSRTNRHRALLRDGDKPPRC